MTYLGVIPEPSLDSVLEVFHLFKQRDQRMNEGWWSESTIELASLVQQLAIVSPAPPEVREVIEAAGYRQEDDLMARGAAFKCDNCGRVEFSPYAENQMAAPSPGWLGVSEIPQEGAEWVELHFCSWMCLGVRVNETLHADIKGGMADVRPLPDVDPDDDVLSHAHPHG